MVQEYASGMESDYGAGVQLEDMESEFDSEKYVAWGQGGSVGGSKVVGLRRGQKRWTAAKLDETYGALLRGPLYAEAVTARMLLRTLQQHIPTESFPEGVLKHWITSYDPGRVSRLRAQGSDGSPKRSASNGACRAVSMRKVGVSKLPAFHGASIDKGIMVKAGHGSGVVLKRPASNGVCSRKGNMQQASLVRDSVDVSKRPAFYRASVRKGIKKKPFSARVGASL